MTEDLHAYVVSLTWSSGMMSLVPVVALRPELASAAAVVEAMRQEPTPEGDLAGVQVREFPVEWMRTAIRMIESGKVEAAPVVQLVPQTHGSAALDEDTRKLEALGADLGPTMLAHGPIPDWRPPVA